MKIDAEYLRRHFAELSDEGLREIDRGELVEAARGWYDEEVARRRAWSKTQLEAQPPEDPEVEEERSDEQDGGDKPEWLDRAMCVRSFVGKNQGLGSAPDVVQVLDAAGVPNHVAIRKMPEGEDELERDLYSVMVPIGRCLEATSVLDRDLFNAGLEEDWRAQFEALTNPEFYALDPDLLCAGFLDAARRLKKAYEDEMAHRRRR